MKEYQARKRIARTIPWGYRVSKHDPDWLEPILTEVQALEQAFHYLKNCSYAETAGWLSIKTGRYLSEIGLLKIHRKVKLQRARRYEGNRVKKRQLRIVERKLPSEAETTQGLRVQSSNVGQETAI